MRSFQKVFSMYYEKQTHLLKILDKETIVHRTVMPQSPSRQTPWDLTQFSQRHQLQQHNVPSALVAESMEHTLPGHVSWQDSGSKPQTQQFWNPQVSFQFSRCQWPIFADCSPYMFNILRGSACCRPSRMWVVFNRILSIFEMFVPHFYLHWPHCIIHKRLLNYQNYFHRGMFKLNAKSDADFLLYWLSHFECNGHTVHMLTQWHLLPPLICTLKSSLFRRGHSSPFSLAARLH